MNKISPLTSGELETGLDSIRQSPKDNGQLELIVRRPQRGSREVLQTGELARDEGLVGDGWSTRGEPGQAKAYDTQLTIINSRLAALLAQDKERWPLAGDQLYIDLDLSDENLPPGTQLSIGTAVIEVTSQPHTGCSHFSSHFGEDALQFVNSPTGRQLKLRGIYARVLQPGVVRVGDVVSRVSDHVPPD